MKKSYHELLVAVSQTARCEILRSLMSSEKSLRDLASDLSTSKVNLIHHIERLSDLNLIQWRYGNMEKNPTKYYSLRDDNVATVVKSIESLCNTLEQFQQKKGK